MYWSIKVHMLHITDVPLSWRHHHHVALQSEHSSTPYYTEVSVPYTNHRGEIKMLPNRVPVCCPPGIINVWPGWNQSLNPTLQHISHYCSILLLCWASDGRLRLFPCRAVWRNIGFKRWFSRQRLCCSVQTTDNLCDHQNVFEQCSLLLDNKLMLWATME